MEHLYSIMPLDLEHLEEICQDIKEQYEKGVANCALFCFQLVPEGNPLVNKAEIAGEKYKLFQDRLNGMGLECGVLVQCSIGHGYALDEPNALTRYVNLNNGEPQYVTCPYDKDFQAYIRGQMKTIASYNPKVIMVDDDFRLIFRNGKGCACPLHIKAYNQKMKSNITREELYTLLQKDEEKDVKNAYVETQREALLQGARAMREGIDEIDEKLQGVFCCVGPTTEFAAEIAEILAGKGNPTVVRINNGNYTPAGARWFSEIAYRAADEINRLKKGGVDVVLAETDTCPQNRYSTGATHLHAHFTASILEGASGAKHWITRMDTYEPDSGKAYRKTLSKYKDFYDTLSRITPTLQWQGCRMPLSTDIRWGFKQSEWHWRKNEWLRCVLERFGFPVYCSAEKGGAVFLEGDLDEDFTDEEIEELFKGTLVLDVFALERLNARGFSKYTGVTVKDWTGKRLSYEKFQNGRICPAQVSAKELIPLCETVRTDSVVCHLAGGKDEQELFPAVTVYQNELGGRVVATCGTPNTPYYYGTAFAYLNESRKKQLARLLTETGDMPIYYKGDAEVYMKTAKTMDGKRFCAVFNIGLDILEELAFVTDERVKGVQILNESGKFENVDFEITQDGVIVKSFAYTLCPVILLMDVE